MRHKPQSYEIINLECFWKQQQKKKKVYKYCTKSLIPQHKNFLFFLLVRHMTCKCSAVSDRCSVYTNIDFCDGPPVSKERVAKPGFDLKCTNRYLRGHVCMCNEEKTSFKQR